MGCFEVGARDGTLREGISEGKRDIFTDWEGIAVGDFEAGIVDIGMINCGFFDDLTLGLCVSCMTVGEGDGFADGDAEALLVGT